MKAWTIGLMTALTLSTLAAAQGVTSITVNGSTAEAEIEFVGGIGADLELSFANVIGLSSSSLGLSATTVSPLDSQLLARLPGSAISIPAAFPVVIEVEPDLESPLSFSGTVTLELHTHNLTYTPNSPLRLFKAPLGGDFVDITAFNGMGSYRVGGSTGGFSQFMVVADLRPLADVIELKFELLQSAFDSAECEIPGVAAALQASLDDAWSSYSGGYFEAASDEIDNFIDVVEANAGSSIPDVWRASRDLTNAAGDLLERAATLRFSLNLAAGS
jgi:hypothetical protein